MLIILLIVSFSVLAAPPEAMFSPYEGRAAFERIYKNIKNAKSTVSISIYSWSDSGITKAMETVLKNNKNIELRVILHRPLSRKESILKKVADLEKLGAMFKAAKMNMHEKFVLVDSEKLVNSSANMSGGAKTKYAEDFVFIDSDGEDDNEELIRDFNREFSIMWNTGDDIVSPGELKKSDILKVDLGKNNTADNNDLMTLHSSSMNFNLKLNKKSSKDYQKGRSIKMIKKKVSGQLGAFSVSKALIRAIDNAEESVYLSLNHFNLYSVSQALIRAVKRGVEVRLAVDNQEFKTKIRDTGRKSIEMTPRFVRDWKALPGNKNLNPPVRIKFYSLAPHHSSWLLNHHKYVIIDSKGRNPVLLAGSFNISKNAEFNQFDNLVEFKGRRYSGLIKDYSKNHNRIWHMNRNGKDEPSKKGLDYFKTFYKKSLIRIHAKSPKNAISLTWSEALKLQSDIGKIAPGIYRNLYSKKGCLFFNVEKQKYEGGSSCK